MSEFKDALYCAENLISVKHELLFFEYRVAFPTKVRFWRAFTKLVQISRVAYDSNIMNFSGALPKDQARDRAAIENYQRLLGKHTALKKAALILHKGLPLDREHLSSITALMQARVYNPVDLPSKIIEEAFC